MNDYPLIRELGLRIIYSPDMTEYVKAIELERVLSEGVKVYAHYETDKPRYWGPSENGQFDDTHTGLVVGIKPIPTPKTVEVNKLTLEKRFWELCEDNGPRTAFEILVKELFGEVSK